MKRIWVLFTLLNTLLLLAQQGEDTLKVDTGAKDSVRIVRLEVKEYRFRYEPTEFRPIDTALDRSKKYLYTSPEHEDEFGRLRLPNIGQGYNPALFQPVSGYRLAPSNMMFGWLSPEEVRYYDVKTPYIRLLYHSGIKNGSALQGLYSQNLHSRWNISFDYFGLRSQGAYLRSLTNNDHMTLGSHYRTANGTYDIQGHYFQQYRRNENSGGIQNLEAFLTADSRFNDRQNFLPNLNSVSSQYGYRRAYILQRLRLAAWREWAVRAYHRLNFSQEDYTYFQTGPESFYPYPTVADFRDQSQKYLHRYGNEVGFQLQKGTWNLEAGFNYEYRKFGSREPVFLAKETLSTPFTEHRLGLAARLQAEPWEGMRLNSTITSDYGAELGAYVETQNRLNFLWRDRFAVELGVDWRFTAPGINFLINSSPYQAFNYQNLGLGHESTLVASGTLGYKPLGLYAKARLLTIQNYTYLDQDYQVQQSAPGVQLVQVSGDWAFQYGKWHADTQLAFQQVLGGKSILPLPNLMVRTQGYWQGRVLRNSAELQAGLTAYFTSGFDSRQLFPVLNEWALTATPQRVAGLPSLDLFTHLRVKRFIVFLEAKQFQNLFLKNKTLHAPLFPQDDFRLNLGIVWHILN